MQAVVRLRGIRGSEHRAPSVLGVAEQGPVVEKAASLDKAPLS